MKTIPGPRRERRIHARSVNQAALLVSTPEEDETYARDIIAITICVGTATAAAANDANVSRGEKLYVDSKCSLCHSVGSKGNPLDEVGSRLSAAEVHGSIVGLDRHGGKGRDRAQTADEVLHPRKRRCG
jgi:mono/diheme cytochrome c family protein